MKFVAQSLQKLETEQTDKHTDRQKNKHDRKRYLPAIMVSNKKMIT